MYHLPLSDEQANKAYARARRAGFLGMLLRLLGRTDSAPLPFDEVRSRLYIRGQIDRGIQTVPIAKIVGSQGRSTDFDRFFHPMSGVTAQRWKSIVHAYIRDVDLPAIELYQISDIYFVRDGNHRVSVARQQGKVDIDAHVIELKTDVPLSPELDLDDLSGKEEQSDFLEWTNLAEMRPDQRIEVTEPGGYLDLISHINRRRTELSHERADEITPQEAIACWYDMVYLPVVEAIRSAGVPQLFPQRTEADLYLAVMNHRQTLIDRLGTDVRIADVVDDFVACEAPWWARPLWKRMAAASPTPEAQTVTDTQSGLRVFRRLSSWVRPK